MSRWGALLLGIGLGGFVDGVLLHQILQWHHMLSHVETDIGLNTLADGLFHAFAWVCVLAGSLLLVAAWRRGAVAPNWSLHIGLLLMGWGLFNLVEGLVNHQLLGIHHVRDDLGGPLSWDLGFLGLALLQIGVGWWLRTRGMRQCEQQVSLHE